MSSTEGWDRARAFELARRCVSKELEPGTSLIGDDVDLVETGVVDSMGWVGILSSIEEATGIRNFGAAWPESRSQSIRFLAETILETPGYKQQYIANDEALTKTDGNLAVSLPGFGASPGSVAVDVEQVERECGLSTGTLRERAGIHSVRRAASDEDEVLLGQRAAELALSAANLGLEDVDIIVATSATFLSYPSLAAVLHARLLLRESCGAVDVGGACVGLIHALATAKAFLSTGQLGGVLVVASEVHSRRLLGPQVPGEFRGLFGDGACAFVLARSDRGGGKDTWRLGHFIWGCSGTFVSSLCLSLRENGELNLQFKGEQLANAAVAQLDRVLDRLEDISGKPRAEVDYFAVHEPNPRVIEVFAQRAKIPLQKIAFTSKTCGNLGSATCGVSLCGAMSRPLGRSGTPDPDLIFMAAVGPGLIWGGTYLQRAR